ncbi:hypothetical protein OH77DRAFT_223682 [Trametes cingulata]|nr:hypothetical protein OH77DRAFT_223682 [Trametes cingulata]
MPTYYLQPGQHAHVYQRPRAYSQSYQHSPQTVFYTHSGSGHSGHSSPGHYATAYPQQQQGVHYASPQYLTPNYQYDPNRRHHYQGHSRSGSGGVYYTSSAPSHYNDSSRRSPSHHASQHRSSSSHGRHHRSQSVPRSSVQVDAGRSHHHRSSSRPRQSPPHHSSQRERRPSNVGEPLSERIRRMFGFGGHHSSSSRNQHRDYVDARTGRTVDWRGCPIYRV